MKNEFTAAMVDDLAEKLLIGLTKEENKIVLDEFAIVKANFDLINEIPNIKSIEPMSFALEYADLQINDDHVEPSIPVEDLLRNCDFCEEREIEVPKVVG